MIITTVLTYAILVLISFILNFGIHRGYGIYRWPLIHEMEREGDILFAFLISLIPIMSVIITFVMSDCGVHGLRYD